jgi:hypothetical protein
VIFVFSYSKTCADGNVLTISDCVMLIVKCTNLFTLYISCVDGTCNKYDYSVLSAYNKNSDDVKHHL